MKDIKFELTSETIVNAWGVTLFRIKATCNIKSRGVKKGELGGFVESTHLSSGDARVSGNAWVYDNAQVSGNAWVSAKKSFTKGWFIGGDDTGKITDITDKTGTTYWANQYVLGDYEINDIEPEVREKPETIQIGGKTYEVTDELKTALNSLKEV
jgi:hypothetical protein